jgi:hypothetical protein
MGTQNSTATGHFSKEEESVADIFLALARPLVVFSVAPE